MLRVAFVLPSLEPALCLCERDVVLSVLQLHCRALRALQALRHPCRGQGGRAAGAGHGAADQRAVCLREKRGREASGQVGGAVPGRKGECGYGGPRRRRRSGRRLRVVGSS